MNQITELRARGFWKCPNVLSGGAGDDFLKGGNGPLNGGTGNDILDGGAGTDTAYYSAANSPIFIALKGSRPAIVALGRLSEGHLDHLINIENLTGTAGSDMLPGDSFANVLSGGANSNTLDVALMLLHGLNVLFPGKTAAFHLSDPRLGQN